MKLTTIDFMGKRMIAAVFSVVLMVLSIAGLAVSGLNLGLDFTGGTLVEVEFEDAVDPEQVRSILDGAGFENGVVQYFGTDRDLLIRMPPQASVDQANMGDDIIATLRDVFPAVEMRQSNFVGPAVGEELRRAGDRQADALL